MIFLSSLSLPIKISKSYWKPKKSFCQLLSPYSMGFKSILQRRIFLNVFVNTDLNHFGRLGAETTENRIHWARWGVILVYREYHSVSPFIEIWHLHGHATWLPPVHVLHEHTWTHIELHQDVGRIALASRSAINIDIRHLQVCLFNVRQDRWLRGHHYGENWPRSSPSSNRATLSCSGRESNPGLRNGRRAL